MDNNFTLYLADLQAKVLILQQYHDALSKFDHTIEIFASQGENVIMINQQCVPFNLLMEIKCLLGDSISVYQETIERLKADSNANI